MTSHRFAFGAFVLDIDRGLLTRDVRTVAVGSRGLALLHELLRAGGKPVRKAELMDAAWPGLAVEESNLSVQIAALRKLLGPAPDGGAWIATVPRFGYRFAGEIEPGAAAPGVSAPAAHPPRPSIAVMPFDDIGGDAGPRRASGFTSGAYCHAARGEWEDARRFASLAGDLPEPARDALEPLRRQNPEWAARIRDLLATIG